MLQQLNPIEEASEKMEKMKKQTRVDYRGKTSNGYYYHINIDGEAAIYCKRGERYQKSKELKKAIREVLDMGRTANYFIWQWYIVPIFEN